MVKLLAALVSEIRNAKLENGNWKIEMRKSKIEIGKWKLETRNQKVEIRKWKLAAPIPPQSVDNVRAGNEEVGARRRLAPTGSTLQVKPDGA
jgi:hypothetical protein